MCPFLKICTEDCSQAGEDLEEDDDDKIEDEEAVAEASSSVMQRDHSAGLSERQPLLGASSLSRSRSRSRRRRMSVSAHGDATVTQAVLMVPFPSINVNTANLVLLSAFEGIRRHRCFVLRQSVSCLVCIYVAAF